MGVHIKKYGLKWLYGRKVYSDNNFRFCVHAQFTGIDRYEI